MTLLWVLRAGRHTKDDAYRFAGASGSDLKPWLAQGFFQRVGQRLLALRRDPEEKRGLQKPDLKVTLSIAQLLADLSLCPWLRISMVNHEKHPGSARTHFRFFLEAPIAA